MKFLQSFNLLTIALLSTANVSNVEWVQTDDLYNKVASVPNAPILAGPTNGSTGIPTNPTLVWNASTGATSYELQVSADSTFVTSVYDTTGLTATAISVGGLSFRTKYYWRVNASNVEGTSSWSAVWSFTTVHQLNWTQINNGLRGITGTSNIYLSLTVNSSGYVFAGAAGNGPYRSTNNGTSWTEITNGLSNTDVHALAINSSGYVFAGVLGGVYRSTNNGASWAMVGLAGNSVLSLAISSAGYMYAGTNGNGVYLSTNGGTSWRQVINGLTNAVVLSLVVKTDGYVLAGTTSGVYASIDNGSSWMKMSNGIPNDNINSLAANSSGSIFAGTNSNGIYISSNYGSSWTSINNGLTNTSVWPIAINSSDNILIGTDGGGVFLSTNNGTSWTQVNDGLTNGVVASLAISPFGYVFAGTYGGGIYRAGISFLFVTPPAPTLLNPTDSSTGMPIGPTLTWNASSGATSYGLQVSDDSTFVTSMYDTSGLTVTSKTVSGLSFQTKYYWRVKASNGGRTSNWSAVWSFTTCSLALVSVKDVPFDQGGKVELIWQASPLDTNVTTLPYYSIWRALPQLTQQSMMVKNPPRASQTRSVSKRTRLMKTASGTFAWEWLANQPAHKERFYSYISSTLYDSMPGTTGIEYFVVSAQTNDPNVFYDSNVDSGYSIDNLPPVRPQGLTASAVFSNVVLRWQRNPDADLMDYVIYRADSVAADAGGTLAYDRTSDIMYTDIHPLLGKTAKYSIRAEDIHGNLSSMSDRVSIIVTNVEGLSTQTPTQYELGQNYPNPFNPSTTISFSLPRTSFVSLKVFDLTGREVATIVSEEMQAGNYSRQWDASKMPSAMYFYRLQAGSYTRTKKLLLLK